LLILLARLLRAEKIIPHPPPVTKPFQPRRRPLPTKKPSEPNQTPKRNPKGVETSALSYLAFIGRLLWKSGGVLRRDVVQAAIIQKFSATWGESDLERCGNMLK
jgi:hypothetical protein